tara:strand:- start:1635 stop:1913 length:279 start_codon:yes stop_codon:yes gene_type:complete
MGASVIVPALLSIASTVISSRSAKDSPKIQPTPLPSEIKDDPAPTVSAGIAAEQDRRRRNLKNLRDDAVGTSLAGLSDKENEKFATPTLLGA